MDSCKKSLMLLVLWCTANTVFTFLALYSLESWRLAQVRTEADKDVKVTIEESTLKGIAESLKKEHDCVHIYSVSNSFEIWTSGIESGYWKSANTLEEARTIVDNYYMQWARNIRGEPTPGILVE